MKAKLPWMLARQVATFLGVGESTIACMLKDSRLEKRKPECAAGFHANDLLGLRRVTIVTQADIDELLKKGIV